MVKTPSPALLQGTLELLILHALQRGPMHGYTIVQMRRSCKVIERRAMASPRPTAPVDLLRESSTRKNG